MERGQTCSPVLSRDVMEQAGKAARTPACCSLVELASTGTFNRTSARLTERIGEKEIAFCFLSYSRSSFIFLSISRSPARHDPSGRSRNRASFALLSTVNVGRRIVGL